MEGDEVRILRSIGLVILCLADFFIFVMYAVTDSAWALIVGIAIAAVAGLIFVRTSPISRNRTHRHRA